MENRFLKVMRRCDVLLITLSVFTSVLLYLYLAPTAQETRPRETPQIVASSPSSIEAGAGETPFAEPKIGDPVRFLMFNAQNYFVREEKTRSRYQLTAKPVRKREAVADVIASAHPHIVGLVEIGGRAAMQDLLERLARRGVRYPYSIVLERWNEDRALALFSRYPIEKDYSVADYMLEGESGGRMLRGILDVLIKLPDGRYFRIMGAHLKSKRAENSAEADGLRNLEARTMAMHVMKVTLAMPQVPILVYGDWNAGPSEPSLSILTQGKIRKSALLRLNPCDDRGESWTLYYRGGKQYSTFDQIYVNSVLSRRMGRGAAMGIVDGDAAEEASDHRAVWCEIR